MSHLKCTKHERRVFVSPVSGNVFHRGVDKNIKHSVCDTEFVEVNKRTFRPEDVLKNEHQDKPFVLPRAKQGL